MGNRIIPAIVAVFFASLLLAGCSADYYAHRIIEVDTTSGKLAAFAANPQAMQKMGQIDEHKRIAATDGTELDVWIIRGKSRKSRGSVVVIHGIMDSKTRLLPLGKKLARKGFDVILPDLRSHGRSGGKYVTFGAREKYDIKVIVETLLGEGEIHEPVNAIGFSMGASTAILYAGIDPRCQAVMAIAPYDDGKSLTRRYLPFMNDEKFQQAWARAGEIANFDPADTNIIAAVQKMQGPLLIVHGRLDNVVPFRHGQNLYNAAREPKELIAVTLAGHSTILALGDDWFAEKFDSLVKKENLKPSDSQAN